MDTARMKADNPSDAMPPRCVKWIWDAMYMNLILGQSQICNTKTERLFAQRKSWPSYSSRHS
jgi:hypothetical protein